MILAVFERGKRLYWCLFLVLVVFGVLPAPPAMAHQAKAAISTILFNSRTDNIEVMHRFILHDAEHAVSKIFGKDADIIGSEKTRKQFASYVAARFSVYRADGSSLSLNIVGQEITQGFIWVYQETPIPDELKSLTIDHKALQDIWVDQVNTVNIRRDNKVRTLSFQSGEDQLTIDFTIPQK